MLPHTFDDVTHRTALGTTVKGPLARNLVPGANRSAGSSVRISTTTSPVTPCDFTTRPTTSSMSGAPLLVGVHHVDADTAATDTGYQSAQCGSGASPRPITLPRSSG